MTNIMAGTNWEDLARAYDRYIAAAFDAQLPDTGWCPVCLDEFAECEYFDYTFDAVKMETSGSIEEEKEREEGDGER